ncbi:MAG: YggS family pyridoxal phosphate-dependent enzyme [Actinomycetales bacterium]
MTNRQLELSENLKVIRGEIPPDIHLIVVTKTFPTSDVEILYRLGEREFGENRDEEGSEKSAKLPEDVIWHFQGRVQSKKIKSLVSWSDYIHSLDNLDHAKKIHDAALNFKKRQNVFLQINLDATNRSENRSGIENEQFSETVAALLELSGIQLVGLMGIAPLAGDPRPGFELLAKLSSKLQDLAPEARFISAGMSGDYRIALEYGATHLRIGSSILGSRTPKA